MLKKRYRIFYGEEILTCFVGTKRAIINRLKNLNTVYWSDSLEFFEVEDTEYNNPLPFSIFTDIELDEMINLCDKHGRYYANDEHWKK